LESKYFCELNVHRRTLSGRKVCDPDKKEKKNNHKNSGHYVPAATPKGSTRALLGSKFCSEDLFGPIRRVALFTQKKCQFNLCRLFRRLVDLLCMWSIPACVKDFTIDILQRGSFDLLLPAPNKSVSKD
jgi:hypothetical protein